MVLESLLFPLKAEKKPWEMFFIGILYSTTAIFLALWIFEKEASMLMVTFTVIACVPIVYNTMKLEESKDMSIDSQKQLMWEHHKAIIFLMCLFLGIVVSVVVWYLVLPGDTVGTLFGSQQDTISQINSPKSTGDVVTGNAVFNFGFFSRVLFNNIKVLAFCILFAFVYGTGSIFILTWNATVIGTAAGNFIRTRLAEVMHTLGNIGALDYGNVVALSVLRYSIHGIPEILAYFYGGLAGGIISVAVIRHHMSADRITNILVDSSELLMLALSFLLLGAMLEVFIVPAFS